MPFQTLNKGFNTAFQEGQLTLGVIAPVEAHGNNPVPTLSRHLERIQLAEALGFSAVWLRDVPFNVPTFGDTGQPFDPFVYLGYLSAATSEIALGVGSMILPLRHPAHVAKAAASADTLSGGRLLLGIASGDRPEEYPAMHMRFDDRAERFRDSVAYIRAMAENWPVAQTDQGILDGSMDMLPKPIAGRVPMLITGGSRQHPDWGAEHADGWITYPRSIPAQASAVADWQERVSRTSDIAKPIMQSLYVDLAEDPRTPPTPIHLGFRSGAPYLLSFLQALREIGVNHVALNLRFNQADVEDTLKRIADEILTEVNA